jgi:hypothetical protein
MKVNLESEWQHYKEAVYPGPISQVQESDLRRCWYASAWSFATVIGSAFAKMSQEDALKLLLAFSENAELECERYVEKDKTRN